MNPVSHINVFGMQLPLYGICYLTGILAAMAAAFLLCKKKKTDLFDFAYSAVFAVFAGLIGAKLLFIAISFREITELGLGFGEIMRGGFVFYGGLLGGIAGLWLFAKIQKVRITDLLDIYAAVLPLGHAIGRLGCHFAGCCYGVEHDGFLSVTYAQSDNLHTPIGKPLLAIQLIESIILLILFAAILTVFFKSSRSGTAANVYLFSYPVIRFTLEFFRGDRERGVLLGLSTSQWTSIVIIAAAVIWLIALSKKKKRAETPA